MASSTKVADAYGWCLGYFQLEEIAGEPGLKRMCMKSKGAVRFGTYFSGSSFISAVSFPYDNKMYQVTGMCRSFDDCLYLPNSDTLVTKQYLINGIVRSLVIYKNFTHRLSPVINGLMPTNQYAFDSTNPDYTFQNSEGYQWPIGGFGASDNGRWLAVEFRQRGVGLFDLETFEMKRVSTLAFNYGIGMDPRSELTVSNDGRTIVIMGLNSDLSILDIVPGCGDDATDDRMTAVLPISNPCKVAQTNTSKYVNRLYYATNPRFSDDGGELIFYTLSYVDGSSSITLRASGYSGQSIDYLALGDSFTSGEGETDDNYYLRGTNDPNEKCHVSIRSYPFLISDFMNIEPLDMANIACSGATMTDITGSNSEYWGQGGRLKKTTNLNNAYKTDAQSYAMYEFIPGRIRQESFVKKYSPKLITVGVGGNDAGLMEKLVACAGKDTCDWASNSESKEQTAKEIKALFGKLVKTYKSLNLASPGSKIYAIGYPEIIDQDGKCDIVTGFLFDETERWFMNESVAYLNQVIEAAAKSAGVNFIDIQNIYGNRVLCGSESPSVMNGGRTGDDNQYNWFLNTGNESFHPNSLGHIYASDAIINSVGNLFDYMYCSDGNVICPDTSIVAPEPSEYWVPDMSHSYPSQKIANYLSDRAAASDDRQKRIRLDSRSLMPNSTAEIEITSETISLGSYATLSDGSLDVDLDLPDNLEEGYHTMHLYGTSYSGEPVELYQVFLYRKTIPKIEIQPPTSDVRNTDGTNDDKATGADNNSVGEDTYDAGGGLDEQYSQIGYSDKPEVMGDYVVANHSVPSNKEVNTVRTNNHLNIYVIIGTAILLLIAIVTIVTIRTRKAN